MQNCGQRCASCMVRLCHCAIRSMRNYSVPHAIRFILATLLLASSAFAARFDEMFLDKTMRVDFFHTGNHGEEVVALDRVVSDGPWPGSRTYLIDSTNLGSYYFEVVDRETNQPIYSRGFSSVFGEWETTDEAKSRAGTFHESLRFPWPRKPVQVVLKKRDKENAFQQIWSTVIDPQLALREQGGRQAARQGLDRFSRTARRRRRSICWSSARATPRPRCRSFTTTRSGSSRSCSRPSRSSRGRRTSTSGRSIIAAGQSGVNRPRTSDDRRTATSVQYNIFDSERYVLTYDNRSLRDVASAAPYDFLEILVNEKQYGGGGIFNDQATASVDSAFSEYVFVHEFGHHFAGLGDEYYTSDVAYETGGEKPEPWEPNLTAERRASEVVRDGRQGRSAADAVGQGGVRGALEGFRRSGASYARRTARSRRWTRSSARSATGRRSSSITTRSTPGRSARSRERATSRRGCTARRSTASCSRATRWGSAGCASARFRGSSTSIRVDGETLMSVQRHKGIHHRDTENTEKNNREPKKNQRPLKPPEALAYGSRWQARSAQSPVCAISWAGGKSSTTVRGITREISFSLCTFLCVLCVSVVIAPR